MSNTYVFESRLITYDENAKPVTVAGITGIITDPGDAVGFHAAAAKAVESLRLDTIEKEAAAVPPGATVTALTKGNTANLRELADAIDSGKVPPNVYVEVVNTIEKRTLRIVS